MFLYIVLSRTETNFARLIRSVTGETYNHVSISLSENLSTIYGYARRKHKNPFDAGLVKEDLSRFTLEKVDYIESVVFKVPVSDEQYHTIASQIEEMLDNREYLYNLFSTLSFPVFKGYRIEKGFTCVEYVMGILYELGYHFEKPYWKYTPQEMMGILSDNIIYEGNLLEYDNIPYYYNTAYFEPFRANDIPVVASSLYTLTKRTIKSIYKR